MEVLTKDSNEESRMVLYTLTVSKLWDGEKLGVGFNGNQRDAPDITEHPWNHALFVICNKETTCPRWVRAAVQVRSPGTGSAHTSSCSPEKRGNGICKGSRHHYPWQDKAGSQGCMCLSVSE